MEGGHPVSGWVPLKMNGHPVGKPRKLGSPPSRRAGAPANRVNIIQKKKTKKRKGGKEESTVDRNTGKHSHYGKH